MTVAILASGKRHVLYFGSMSDVRNRKRYRGYSRAIQEAGLEPMQISPNKVSSVSIGADMLALIRQMYPLLDAIFCTNDDIAVGGAARVPAPVAGRHALITSPICKSNQNAA